MAEYLDYDGLNHFKDKNDETYIKQEDTEDLTQLTRRTSASDDFLILLGDPDTGILSTITVNDFSDSLPSSSFGTETIGSASRPIYIDSGEPKAITATVGNDAHPVYMSTGNITTCAATVGSGVQPVYMNGGTITASTSTVGSATTPVYMNAGTITACDSGFGDDVTESDVDDIFE